MKILHCLAQLPTRTGSGVYYRNLIKEFDRQGDVEQAGIFGLNSNHSVNWLELDQTYPVHFETPELPFPIAGMSDEMPYPSTVYHQMKPEMIGQWQAAFRKQLILAKEQFQPDLIICHHLWMLAALVLEVFPETPVIAISHGTDLRQAKQNPSMAAAYVGSLSKLELVLALSQSDVEDLCRVFGLSQEQVRVTGGAYDPEVFYPNRLKLLKTEPQPVRMIYAGKLVESKGIYELAAAYRLARKSFPNMTLDLVGKTSPEINARIDRLSGSDATIRMFDAESQMKLAMHLRRSDLFVFPSYYEGMGLIALEALASGLHLVSNRLPGLNEQLGSALINHPVISWVEMPPLVNTDELVPSAREDYVERLALAILEQAQAIAERQDNSGFPFEEIQKHGWNSLASRVRQLVDEIIAREG